MCLKGSVRPAQRSIPSHINSSFVLPCIRTVDAGITRCTVSLFLLGIEFCLSYCQYCNSLHRYYRFYVELGATPIDLLICFTKRIYDSGLCHSLSLAFTCYRACPYVSKVALGLNAMRRSMSVHTYVLLFSYVARYPCCLFGHSRSVATPPSLSS